MKTPEWLNNYFELRERGTTPVTEVLAGVTTFTAMSYIIFVQPAILHEAGAPQGGVFFATCVASAVACILTGLLANLPIALAPAMGHNAFFTYTVCAAMGFAWQEGLAAVCIGGLVFMVLSFFGVRAALMRVIPDNLKKAIAGGIGLMITLMGLQHAGLVVDSNDTLVTFGNLASPHTLLAVAGLALTLILMAWDVKGAVLFGIATTGTIGYILTLTGIPLLNVSNPPTFNPSETFLALDFAGLFTKQGAVAVILTFLFLDVFDTVGTLVGVGQRTGLMDEKGNLPGARWALFSDATGTALGAVLGTSTITSYVESAAGIQAGGRTGLSNLVTAGLFLLALPLYPVLAVISSPVGPKGLYPVIAPALIVVGGMMVQGLEHLDWEDPTELLPAFLTVVLIPLAVSITDGIAVGCITYSFLKLCTGRWRDVHWAFHCISGALLLRYIFLT